MRYFDSGFTAAMQAARSSGIAPVYFAWFTGKDRGTGNPVSMGLWSRGRDITTTVPLPNGSGNVSRVYIGGCGMAVEGLQYVSDLGDNPVNITISQIADAAQYLVRGLDLRLASCEIHATSMVGGAFVSAPQLQWVGIVDDGPINTPAAGGEGGISIAVRSEVLSQLSATNPAKTSDAHQRRRQAGDEFAKYASTISARRVQWYTGDD